MSIKAGQQARVQQPVIEGTILKVRYNEGREELEGLLDYSGTDGENHERWFLESELTVETAAAEGEAP